MATRYINPESLVEDGLTPSTGYHNITNLVAAEGPLADGDVTLVVYTLTPIIETYNPGAPKGIPVRGIVKAAVGGNPASFPKVDCYRVGQGDSGTWNLQSNCTVKNIEFVMPVTNVGWWQYSGLHTEVNSENVTISACKFSQYPVGYNQILNHSVSKSLTIKNCLIYTASCDEFGSGTVVSNIPPTDLAGNVFVFVENTLFTNYKGGATAAFIGPVKAENCKLLAYNNILSTQNPITYYAIPMWNVSRPSFPADLGTVDYNIWGPSAGGQLYTNVSLNGGHNLANTDPLLAAPLLQDFSIQAGSPARNSGANNAYTPNADILDHARIPYNDIGAYEYAYLIPAVLDPVSPNNSTELGTLGTPWSGPSGNLQIVVGGAWKPVLAAFVLISGVWKAVLDVQVNITSSWKRQA